MRSNLVWDAFRVLRTREEVQDCLWSTLQEAMGTVNKQCLTTLHRWIPQDVSKVTCSRVSHRTH